MAFSVPKPNVGHNGHQTQPVMNFSSAVTGMSDPEWYNYLGFDSEEEYNRDMNLRQLLKEKEKAGIGIYYMDDESSEFFGFSYDEILAMYDNGTVIPDEVLNWAREMAQNNPVTEDAPAASGDAEALYMSLKNNPDVNIKTITEIFSKKCDENRLNLDSYNEEFIVLLKDITVQKGDIEIIVEDAKKQTAPLKDEWDDLSYKLMNGVPLTEEELTRADELKDEFGQINDYCKEQIASVIVNIGSCIDKLAEVEQKIDIANSYSRITKLVLDELDDVGGTSENKSIIKTNSYGEIDDSANDNLNSNYTTALSNTVYQLDSSINDVYYKTENIHGTLNEIAETGGFKLDDPNHSVTLSFMNDVDFSILAENDEANETSETEEDLPEEFEDLTIELEFEDELNPEYAYNPDGAKEELDYLSYIPDEEPYIKAPESTNNFSGKNNRR